MSHVLLKPGPNELMAIGCVVLAFGLASLILTLEKRTFPISAFCVIPILLLMVLFRPLSTPWLGRDPSGRTLAAELTAAHLAEAQIYPTNMKRGQLYSLSFYLHREIRPWDSQSTDPGILLITSPRCQELVPSQFGCPNNPIRLYRSGWLAYRLVKKVY